MHREPDFLAGCYREAALMSGRSGQLISGRQAHLMYQTTIVSIAGCMCKGE
jgi:hypothetical protein